MTADQTRRRSSLHTVATLGCTAATLVLLNQVLPYVYTPNMESYGAYARTVINSFTQIPAIPEPLEQLQYAVSVGLGLLLLALFAVFFGRLLGPPPSLIARRPWLGEIPAWILGGLTLIAVFLLSKRDAALYLGHSMLVKYPLAHWCCVLPVSYLFYVRGTGRRSATSVRVLLWAYAVLVVTVALANALLATSSPPPSFHFNPVVYPIAMMRNGAGLTRGILSLYGLYPTYVAPLVGLLGRGILSVYVVFGLLLGVTSIALIYTSSRVIRNPCLRLCVAIALPYEFYLTRTPMVAEPYYQYFPIRMLFPSLLLATLAWTVRTSRRDTMPLAVASGVAVTGLLWNLDSGAACVLSLGAYLGIRWLFGLLFRDKMSLRHLATVTGELISPLLVGGIPAVALFCCVYWLQAKSWPDIKGAIAATKLLAAVGYSFIPLPNGMGFVHVWILALGVCGFYGYGLFLRRSGRMAAFQVAVAVMGLGALVYHMGRSHPATLMGPLWLLPLVIGLVAERVWENLRGVSMFAFGRVVHLFLLAYLCSAPIACGLMMPSFWEQVRTGLPLARSGHRPAHYLAGAAKFIKQHAGRHRRAAIFVANSEGVLYLLTGLQPAIRMSSSTDLIFREEQDRIVRFLKQNTDIPIFVVSSPGQMTSSPEITGTIASYYRPKAIGKEITLLERRPPEQRP
ncbi:MAG TPA: hypothetical protein VIV60_05330 [Polyangiaceae bacterium]